LVQVDDLYLAKSAKQLHLYYIELSITISPTDTYRNIWCAFGCNFLLIVD